MENKYCLLTNDVETTSIVNNSLSDKTGEKILKEGMPLLLELYTKYDINSTFFITGNIAKKFPKIVEMIIAYGHEVGSHGWTHEPDLAFDILNLQRQIDHLKKSKELLEDISCHEVISFRAPAGRVNSNTAIALHKTGFKIDSSISSQRFDFFLSFGGIKKLNWLFSPRLPYYLKKDNLWKKGDSEILEIPISSLMIPYIGTTMRIFPNAIKILRYLLDFENSINKKPIVFLTHPNEYIIEDFENINIRRSQNYFGYLFRDVLRRRIKIKNLGSKGLSLYENEIRFFKKKEYKFISLKQYYLNYGRKMNNA